MQWNTQTCRHEYTHKQTQRYITYLCHLRSVRVCICGEHTVYVGIFEAIHIMNDRKEMPSQHPFSDIGESRVNILRRSMCLTFRPAPAVPEVKAPVPLAQGTLTDALYIACGMSSKRPCVLFVARVCRWVERSARSRLVMRDPPPARLLWWRCVCGDKLFLQPKEGFGSRFFVYAMSYMTHG